MNPVQTFIEELLSEHRKIESMAGAFVTFTRSMNESCDPLHLEKFLKFFNEYCALYHHGREENTLIPALVATGIGEKSAPIRFIKQEHKEGDDILKHIEKIAVKFSKSTRMDDESKAELQSLSEKYCSLMWEHIDKENSVLFEELRLRVKRIVMQQTNISLLESESIAKEMLALYPPIDDLPDLMRGDGCIHCRHYGSGCRGIEGEWFTDYDWEDFFERNNRS